MKGKVFGKTHSRISASVGTAIFMSQGRVIAILRRSGWNSATLKTPCRRYGLIFRMAVGEGFR